MIDLLLVILQLILTGGVMKTVNYNTENAVFQFAQSDVLDHLISLVTEANLPEVDMIEKYISTSQQDPVTIPVAFEYFNVVALDLIKKNKSSVTCKLCDKTYQSSEIKPTVTGHGKHPINMDRVKEIQELKLKDIFRRKWIKAAIENFKDLFRKNKPHPGMFGGKGYECPKGHELISMITWRT